MPRKYQLMALLAWAALCLGGSTSGPGPPSRGLLGHWPLEGDALDTSGHNRHGRINGAVPAPGRFGGGFYFDGNSTIDLGPLDFPSDAFTVSGWIRPGDPPHESLWRNWIIQMFDNGDAADATFRLGVQDGRDFPGSHNEGMFAVARGGTSVVNVLTLGVNLRDGRWHCMTATYAPGDQRLYIDGILARMAPAAGCSNTYAGPLPRTSGPVTLGGDLFGRHHKRWVGEIDEVVIYDRALSAEEVVQLMPFPLLVRLRVWLGENRVALLSVGGCGAVLSLLLTSRYLAKRRQVVQLRDALLAQEQVARAELESRNTELEVARQAADKANLAKSQFLASMSHEIRTPLNAILGYSQILTQARDLPSSHRAAVDTIARSGEHLLGLVNDVLDLSKVEAGRVELHMAPFDLPALLSEMNRLFAPRCREKGVEFSLDLEPPFPGPGGAAEVPAPVTTEGAEPARLLGDERRLRQVLLNLLGNAVKFTRHGGIRLRVRPQPPVDAPGTARLPAALPVGASVHQIPAPGSVRIRFEVIDTGPGIPADLRPRLFQPFEQARSPEHVGGTGLGLAIASRLVRLMGGDLGCDSPFPDGPEAVPGGGSRFWVELPFAPAPAGGPPARPGPDPQANAARRLRPGFVVKALVVDDIAENRDVVRLMLAGLGCQVRVAASGQEGVDLALADRPDIVFMDIRMPGLDGLRATELIRRHYAALPDVPRPRIIALSASAFAHEQARYAEAGFDLSMTKPVRHEQLVDCLRAMLQVEFDSGEPPGQGTGPPDWTPPEPLRQALCAAATNYNLTDLNRLVDDLEHLGDDGRRFAARLRGPLARVDFAAIRDLLA